MSFGGWSEWKVLEEVMVELLLVVVESDRCQVVEEGGAIVEEGRQGALCERILSASQRQRGELNRDCKRGRESTLDE